MPLDVIPIRVDMVVRDHVRVDLNFNLNTCLEQLCPELQLPAEACEVEILFTDDQEIQSLNSQYRGKDRPTDVLSFPDGDLNPETGAFQLGSIAISLDTAKRQAAEIGHSLVAELRFLILHGLLHLLGFDHETDNGEMMTEQKRILRNIDIPREVDNAHE